MNEKNARKLADELGECLAGVATVSATNESWRTGSERVWGVALWSRDLFGPDEPQRLIVGPDELADMEREFPAIDAYRTFRKACVKFLTTLAGPGAPIGYSPSGLLAKVQASVEEPFTRQCAGVVTGDADSDRTCAERIHISQESLQCWHCSLILRNWKEAHQEEEVAA